MGRHPRRVAARILRARGPFASARTPLMSEGTGAGAPPAIELRDIVKRFPGVVANDHVNVKVAHGSIHAIVGENGAGKSTLMKVLYGSLKPDEGTVTVNGVEQHFRSPKDAINVGIGMVFQHFMLADNFTVWENVVLGDEPGTPVKLNIREAQGQDPGAGQALRPRHRPRRAHRRARCGRTPAGRDPQGALPRRAHHHPRRADRRPRAPGGRRALRVTSRAGGRWGDGDLHLPQAERGAVGRRRDHRHPRRPHRGRGAAPGRDRP